MFQDIIKKALSGLTNGMLENKKPLLEILNNLNLTEGNKVYLIIKSNQWSDLIVNNAFIEELNPSPRLEVLNGSLGSVKVINYTLNLITNAFESPINRVEYSCAMLFIEDTNKVFALSDINF